MLLLAYENEAFATHFFRQPQTMKTNIGNAICRDTDQSQTMGQL